MLSIFCYTFINHQEIKCHPERITKIKPFINNFSWKNINFSPTKQDFNNLK